MSSPADNQMIAAFGTQTLLCEASMGLSQVLAILTQSWHGATAGHFQSQDRSSGPVAQVNGVPGATHIVVMDDRSPMGCLAWGTLLPQLLAAFPQDAPSRLSDIPNLSLGEWAGDRLESIQCVSAHLSVAQFWDHVHRQAAAKLPLHWGIVNPDTTEFEGLVNVPQVLRVITTGAPMPESASIAAPTLGICEAIQHLQFPLMVRTAAGDVVAQNQAWQSQLEQFFAPQALTQAAIALLDQLPVAPPQTAAPAAQGAYCQPGITPNSCLCTCPTEDGQLRIWKFLLQPLSLDSKLLGGKAWERDATEEPGLAEAAGNPDSAPYSLVMAVDMTDSHHLIENLQAQVANLTIANHLKNDFLAEISHDIKNPLTAIVGLSHVLNHHGLGELPKRQAHYVELIEQKSQQLMGIVNNLLDLHRIQTQSLALTPEVTPVRSVCEQAVAQAIASFALKNDQAEAGLRSIEVEVDPQIDSIVADTLRLQQILVYLLAHTLDLAPTAESIELTVQRWGGWIGFTVRSSEVHIPQEHHHLLFRLPQVWGTDVNAQAPQTGLNLLLAQRLAQLHGGDLSFVAAQDLGEQLTALIPPVLIMDDVEERAAAIAPLSKRLILVIATYPNLLASLHQHLTQDGYHMVVARSGAEALEKVQHLHPQAIFLHLPLPLVSGWDVLTILQHDATAQQCPIVVLGEPAQQTQAQQRGVQHFLSLPLSPQQLSECLAVVLPRDSLAPDPPEVLPAESPDLPVDAGANNGQAPVTMVPPGRPILNLTVLHLESLSEISATAAPWTQVGQRLHLQGCRVITTDSIDEATLLARIWKPRVVLYTRLTAETLLEIELDSPLLDLPFVVLHPAVAAIARQIPQLTVYGCSLFSEAQVSTIEADMAILIQILKVAAGVD